VQILGVSKKQALSRGQIGCVGEVATLNVARGCAGACVFCYARCYTGAPPPGQLLLYSELPQLLRRELDAAQRKAPLPAYVVVATATDGFLGGPPVLQVTRACLEILLNRSIGVSVSTRGAIPDEIMAVVARHAPMVQATVALPSLSEEYSRGWEPGAARPSERLFAVQRLLQAGVRTRVRLEPIIPFVNDHTEQMRDLISALVGLGLREATVSFLHLRPGVTEQLQREAPADLRRLVLGCFQAQHPHLAGRPPVFQHLPERQRLAGLRRLQRIGREHGFRLTACHCQNPGLPASRCPVAPPEQPGPRGTQGRLFGEGD
jgi:DNA repair photolyase